MKGTLIKFCDDHAFVSGQYGFVDCPYCKLEYAHLLYDSDLVSIKKYETCVKEYEHRKLVHEHAFYKEWYYAIKKVALTLLVVIAVLCISLAKHIK